VSGASGRRVSAKCGLARILDWYFTRVYGHWEGPGTVPFYCDVRRVGHFASDPGDVARGDEDALFRLFVTMAMFQARRDVIIMSQQRSMARDVALSLTSPSRILDLATRSACDRLQSATVFDARCDIRKNDGIPDCSSMPRAPCYVKDAATALRRMGDMGKLPTSAALHLWRPGQLQRELDDVISSEMDPIRRAEVLVERFSRVYRVGRKLASLFVSALSVPALAPGLTPWFPGVDGSELVVVDTNVARVTDAISNGRAGGSYLLRARWIIRRSKTIDLRRWRSELPAYAPRIVQQAMYFFGSQSNRSANRDPCSVERCAECVGTACPFACPS
jgi:hypothetical protein